MGIVHFVRVLTDYIDTFCMQIKRLLVHKLWCQPLNRQKNKTIINRIRILFIIIIPLTSLLLPLYTLFPIPWRQSPHSHRLHERAYSWTVRATWSAKYHATLSSLKVHLTSLLATPYNSTQIQAYTNPAIKKSKEGLKTLNFYTHSSQTPSKHPSYPHFQTSIDWSIWLATDSAMSSFSDAELISNDFFSVWADIRFLGNPNSWLSSLHPQNGTPWCTNTTSRHILP